MKINRQELQIDFYLRDRLEERVDQAIFLISNHGYNVNQAAQVVQVSYNTLKRYIGANFVAWNETNHEL